MTDKTAQLFDMHCHLSFAPDAFLLAKNLAKRSIGCFSVTVSPADYQAALHLATPVQDERPDDVSLGRSGALSREPLVRVGAGLHPWWLADGRCTTNDAEVLVQLIETTPFVGEIGLDFARGRDASRDTQLAALELIVQACATQGNKLISLHAVQAAGTLLQVLERYGCAEKCTCILHWFSGSSDELTRAINLGCYFSVGQRMLASKRGRAYVLAIPRDRLLLETDLPSDDGSLDDASTIERSLVSTLEQLETLRGEKLAETIAHTSRLLLR